MVMDIYVLWLNFDESKNLSYTRKYLMEPKTLLIRIGDFFFKYRNAIFPAVMLTLFLSARPPLTYFGSETLEDMVDTIAVGLVLGGLALRGAVIGYRYIKRGGLNKKVYAENLVTDGFFGVCRNPLYVGNMMIYEGVLLKHGNPMTFILGTLFFMFVYKAIIAAEEYFLRNEFGEAYKAYCADVPRWRMQWSKLKGATEGMKFNLRRALIKDYSTIANGLVTLLILEMLEQQNDATGASVDWLPLVAMMAAVVAAALAVRVAKKRKILVAD
jgi:protein-S-isoprenylcysteine O-methyltransferase Ste14